MPHPGQGKQIGSQTVVKANQLTDSWRRQTSQESAQGGLVGKPLKTQHREKRSIVLQDVGLDDPAQSHDDGEHQSQNKFGRMIDRSIAESLQMSLEQSPKSYSVAKTLNQPHPAKVGESRFVEGKTDISGSFWHMTQTYPLDAFVSWTFYHINFPFPSSAIHPFVSLLKENSRIIEVEQ